MFFVSYGGGIWHSWLDRDLSVAGRIVVTDQGGAEFKSRLVKVDRPVLRIPTLAIHCMYYYGHLHLGMVLTPIDSSGQKCQRGIQVQ